MKQYYAYIIGNARPTMYVGVTNDLVRRMYEHRNGLVDGFTKRYQLQKLLYFEVHTDIREAILREKRLKGWRRSWKLELIRKVNPRFRDLTLDIQGLDSGFRRNDNIESSSRTGKARSGTGPSPE